MSAHFLNFLRNEDGATAIEYAIMAAGIALAVSAAVFNLGQVVLTSKFNIISNAVNP